MTRKLTLALVALTLILAACAPVQTTPAPTAAPLTFTDGLGRTVTLATAAQKIVSMAPSNTEVLFAVGAGAQVVGRDEFSDYPEVAKALPSIGGSMGQYSNEQIVALQPDLVLAGGINTPEQVKALEDLGVTVFYLGNPTTLEEMYANLELVAKLTGHETATATLVDLLKARVKAVDDKVAAVTNKPVTFYEIDATDANKPYTAGPGTFIDALIARAGGVSFASAAGITDAYPQVGFEKIIEVNPNIIILGDSMWGVTAESVAARTGWDALAAVKNNQIFAFDDNLVSRPGPRLVDGLEALAKILHPELFK